MSQNASNRAQKLPHRGQTTGFYQKRRLVTVKKLSPIPERSQNLKYAIDFRTLPSQCEAPVEMKTSANRGWKYERLNYLGLDGSRTGGRCVDMRPRWSSRCSLSHHIQASSIRPSDWRLTGARQNERCSAVSSLSTDTRMKHTPRPTGLTLSVSHFSDCSKMSLPNRSAGPYWSNPPFF